MGYRSELEARLAKKTTKAIVDYQMIDEGDRVMVGLSGGKDSWALLQLLDVLRQRAPIRFSLVAVTVDSGYKEYKHDLIAKTCVARGWEWELPGVSADSGEHLALFAARRAIALDSLSSDSWIALALATRLRDPQRAARPPHLDTAPTSIRRRRFRAVATSSAPVVASLG